jgi:hypothetical protein
MSELPKEIRDDKIGLVARSSVRLSVGHANETRAVIISFDDIGVVVAITPAAARRLADELKMEADLLAQ